MQLHPIALNERQAVREVRPHRDAVLHRFAMDEIDHLPDRFVDVQAILSGRRFFDVITNPADDVARSMAVLDDASERLPHLLQIRRSTIQKAQCRLGVDDGGGDGLFHFMGDRRRELSHGCDAVRMRQLHLHLAVAALALACFRFRPLALGQIEHERDALVSTSFEGRRPDQHRHAAAVFPQIFLLEWLRDPGTL